VQMVSAGRARTEHLTRTGIMSRSGAAAFRALTGGPGFGAWPAVYNLSTLSA
jgi:hypothetical protein